MKKITFILFLTLLIFASLWSFTFAADDAMVPVTVRCQGRNLPLAYTYHGNIYLRMEDFIEYGHTEKLTFDTEKCQIFFDPAELDIFVADGETTDFIRENSGTVHVSMRWIDKELYVSLKLVAQMARLDYRLEDDILTLYPDNMSGSTFTVTKDCTGVQPLALGGADIQVRSGSYCTLEKELKAYYLVNIRGGQTVYLMKDCIGPVQEGKLLPEFSCEAKEKRDYSSGKINIAWDVSPASAPDPIEGIDIICPFKWFYQMVEEDCVIGNNGNAGYVDICHRNGYDVWATITNDFSTKGSTKYTTKVLADETMRNKTIAQYLMYCAIYGVDGVNIDYEDLTSADKKNFTEFISTFVHYADRMGLTFSVATLVPESWNLSLYDYMTLGKVCDYVIPMCYDEHYSVKSGEGSTSSLSWFRRQISGMCSYVDKNKIIAAFPLYSFVNKYDANGSYIACDKLRITTCYKEVVEAIAEKRIVSPVTWDDAVGQYAVSYRDGNYVNKIWLEDKRSAAMRLQAVLDYDIAGSACFEFRYADPGFFDIFSQVYGGADPSSIAPGYFDDGNVSVK